MRYEIQTKQDLSGMTLIVRFPEADLDEKALYTIQADRPDFLLPFHYRSVDGQAECAYQLGSYSKLQYRFGRKAPQEYVRFWEMLLQPLLDCGDWFLKPFSFVLDARYIYVDQTGKRIGYLYIPSRTDCTEFDELKKLAMDLAEQNPATDSALENRTLRAIMQNFQPKTFLQALRETAGGQITDQKPAAYEAPQTPPAPAPYVPAPQPAPQLTPPARPAPPPMMDAKPAPKPAPERRQDQSGSRGSFSADPDDIVIDLGGGGAKPAKEKGGLFGKKKEKPAKEKPVKEKPVKEKNGGLFNGKNKGSKEIMLGAAELRQQPAGGGQYPVGVQEMQEDFGVTQIMAESTQTRLVLVGDQSLPREITVDIAEGRTFTIGRFDVSLGYQQSSFEFDKRTRAVSRHHAAIERHRDGYVLVDTGSSAGTFLNGARLTPNAAYPLHRGDKVSFGNSGADYMWEEA